MSRSSKSRKKKPQPTEASSTQVPKKTPLNWLPVVLGITLAIQPLLLYLHATDEYETPKLIFLRCATALVLLAWCHTAYVHGQVLRLKHGAWALLAFVAAMVMATLASKAPVTSFIGEYGSNAGLQSQVCYALICAAGMSLINRDQVRTVLIFVLLGAILSTGMALVEAAGHEIGTFFGMTAEIPSHSTSGTFGNANYFAGYTVAILPITIHLTRDRSNPVRYIAMVVAAASGLAAIISGSRTGIACVVVLLVWVVIYLKPYLYPGHSVRKEDDKDKDKDKDKEKDLDKEKDKREKQPPQTPKLSLVRRGALILAAAVVIVVSIASYAAINQLKRVGRSLTRPMVALTVDRTHLWSPAVDIFFDNPLLGSGLDTYATRSPQYFEPRVYKRLGASVTARRAHNEMLNMLACSGIVGVCCWLWLFLGGMWRGLSLVRAAREDAILRDISLALTAGLVVGWSFNLLHFITVGQAPWLFVLAGILLGPGLVKESTGKTWHLPKSAALAGGALSLALFLFFAMDGRSWIKADIELKHSLVASMRGRLGTALEHVDNAAKLRPIERRYHEARAQMYVRAARAARSDTAKMDRLNTARESIHRALELNRAPLALWIALAVERGANNVDTAATLAVEALQRDPTRPGELRRAVDWFFKRGRIEYAVACLEPVLERAPDMAADLTLSIAASLVKSAPVQPERREEYLTPAESLTRRLVSLDDYNERANKLLELINTRRQ